MSFTGPTKKGDSLVSTRLVDGLEWTFGYNCNADKSARAVGKLLVRDVKENLKICQYQKHSNQNLISSILNVLIKNGVFRSCVAFSISVSTVFQSRTKLWRFKAIVNDLNM